jgi:[ribosomal protein S5]-alanine N-acetyltransferase
MIILETSRLLLREMHPDDAQQAYELNLDPEVVKYTGDVSFTSREEAKDFLIAYKSYQKYGFGRWAVILKSNQEFLGWCGLKYTPELDEFDIGFRFFKKHWNHGYASEAASACLEFGFTKFKMKTIVGRAMSENKASLKVLEKIGLVFWEDRISAIGVEKVYRKMKP